MFGFLRRKKKSRRSFDPKLELGRLSELSPPSALVYLHPAGKSSAGAPEELGKAFLLRREQKLYSDGDCAYITTPDGLKASHDQSLRAQHVTLQFFHRRVPHRVDCRVIGRFRLRPEVTESLDFRAKTAYKLTPTGPIKKDEKRQYLRYVVRNYGDSRIPLTTHITFDLYLQGTNKEFPVSGATPMLIDDLELTPFRKVEPPRTFTTRDAIDQLRQLMLQKPLYERQVYVTKVIRDRSPGTVRKPDTEVLLGQLSLLGLEMGSLRDVLYVKKATREGTRRGDATPHALHPGETILASFSHAGQHYEMACEVMEARTQNEVVRPLEFMREEVGLKVGLVNFSSGGVLVESSLDVLKMVLGSRCPPGVEAERDFGSHSWQKALDTLKIPMVQLTFYPQRRFPDALKQFEPELPYKVSLITQIVRSHLVGLGNREVLQHGMVCAYEPQGVQLKAGEPVRWRYIRHVKDNEYFKQVHIKLSHLYGHLETQSLSSRTARMAR